MTSYIPWADDRLRWLTHGLYANIPHRYFRDQLVHGHRCTDCGHEHVCTCPPDTARRRELLRCPWCTPWKLEWAKPPRKPRRRKTTRRVLQAVP